MAKLSAPKKESAASVAAERLPPLKNGMEPSIKKWSVDFETNPIEPPPFYPPKPVGVAIRRPNEKKAKYYAWGHPTDNNCDINEVRLIFKEMIRDTANVLFHNSMFDWDILKTFFGIEIPWNRVDDTLFLLFLFDPYAPSLALKPSAERLLGMPPTERDAVKEWLIAHKICRDTKNWGAHIGKAPGGLVGKYAAADLRMTDGLWDFLAPRVLGVMRKPYDRERRLMPMLVANTHNGLLVSQGTLGRIIDNGKADLQRIEAFLFKAFGKEINLDSGDALADALFEKKIVTAWDMTPSGKRATNKQSLTIDKFKRPEIWQALTHRSKLSTCLNTFAYNWAEMCGKTGRIYTEWNQVRGERGGARTGRMSCTPNFQNVPNDLSDKNDGYSFEQLVRHIKGLNELPKLREAILPNAGAMWVHRDYSQQELRILAARSGGALAAAFREKPNLDLHEYLAGYINSAYALSITRRQAKDINFGLIYGLGLDLLAEKLGLSKQDAKLLKKAQADAIPDMAAYDKEIKFNAKVGTPMQTDGGRLYWPEEPSYSDKFKRWMDYNYKMVNYSIQGSAGDMTKDAIIAYHEHPERDGDFLVAVHDDINVCSGGKSMKAVKHEAEVLRKCMSDIDYPVPMVSDLKVGPSWGTIKKLG